MPNHQHNYPGYVAIVSVLLVSSIAVVSVAALSSLLISKQKEIRNVTKSSQSYYAAEAGIEDALLRVTNPDFTYDETETLTVAGTAVNTTIDQSQTLGQDTIDVTASGNLSNRHRSITTQLTQTPNVTSSFIYGLYIDAGGLFMRDKAKVIGSVYTNGNIDGQNQAEITGDAWTSGQTHIDDIVIGADAHSNTITNSSIGGDAYYQTLTDTDVTGSEFPGSSDPEVLDLLLKDETITTWKNAAESGEVRTEDYVLDGTDTDTLGLVKINGNATIGGSAVLTLTGALWVTGDLILENDAAIELDSTYGDDSGVIIADGHITIRNDSLLCGSEGYDANEDACNTPNNSYILMLSTNTSLDDKNPAISFDNATNLRGILYAGEGLLDIRNTGDLVGATGYRIEMRNFAQITYEVGISSVEFNVGPGGGWAFGKWLEVE